MKSPCRNFMNFILITLHIFLTASVQSYPYNGVKVSTYPVPCPVKCELPYAVQVPKNPQPDIEQYYWINDRLRGKTYNYNIQVPAPEIPRPPCEQKLYNFGIQVPTPPVQKYMGVEVCDQPIKRLTGLKTRVDRVLVPSCDVVCA